MSAEHEDITPKITIPEFKFALTEELVLECNSREEFSPEDFLPTRAENRATGWDVRCAEPEGFELMPGCYLKIPLGIHMLAPEGWWLDLKPRSSTFTKRHLHALYGTIDETYPGQLLFACQYQPDACEIISRGCLKRVEFGDRIGQVIPVKREEMTVSITTLKELHEEHANRNSERTGGFGSSGSK
jgi:dUTPase